MAKQGDPLSDYTARDLHGIVYGKCWPDQAGRHRQIDIDAFEPIADLPPHHLLVDGEMRLFGNELEDKTSSPPPDAAEAVRIGIWAHMELVRIHPFQEGNGKTARLLMDVVLMRNVLGPKRGLIIPPSMRDRYIHAVQAHRGGNASEFESLVLDMLELTLKRETALKRVARPRGRERRLPRRRR